MEDNHRCKDDLKSCITLLLSSKGGSEENPEEITSVALLNPSKKGSILFPKDLIQRKGTWALGMCYIFLASGYTTKKIGKANN